MMDRIDRMIAGIIFIFLLIIFVSFSYAVIETAENVRNKVEEAVKERDNKHLTMECEQYYNDGTGRWAECMGVGHK